MSVPAIIVTPVTFKLSLTVVSEVPCPILIAVPDVVPKSIDAFPAPLLEASIANVLLDPELATKLIPATWSVPGVMVRSPDDAPVNVPVPIMNLFTESSNPIKALSLSVSPLIITIPQSPAGF